MRAGDRRWRDPRTRAKNLIFLKHFVQYFGHMFGRIRGGSAIADLTFMKPQISKIFIDFDRRVGGAWAVDWFSLWAVRYVGWMGI